MNPARHPSPDPGRTAFTAHPGFRAGRWLLAVPAHLTMVAGVLAVVVTAASTALVAESSPLPPEAVAATPAPSPSPTGTAGTEVTGVTASPEPTDGWDPASEALVALHSLEVADTGSMAGYDRSARFGDWIDADDDCASTRDEILARDLTDMTTEDGCTVASGTLDDPYTGELVRFTRGVTTSSDVQIDHVVAAGNAWASGARDLSQAERVAFYNDPLNLLAVAGPVNASKSDSPADEWLPPEESFRCEYVATQIAVKAEYGLQVTTAEKAAMAGVLSTCPGQELPTDHRNEDPR